MIEIWWSTRQCELELRTHWLIDTQTIQCNNKPKPTRATLGVGRVACGVLMGSGFFHYNVAAAAGWNESPTPWCSMHALFWVPNCNDGVVKCVHHNDVDAMWRVTSDMSRPTVLVPEISVSSAECEYDNMLWRMAVLMLKQNCNICWSRNWTHLVSWCHKPMWT